MSWQNRVLRIDLTTGRIREEPLVRDWALRYLGQRGLGSKYLSDGMDPGVDPLAPENLLILATGPLTATRASTASRYSVITKGALTGAIACSNSGGRFGAELKLAGYDLLLIAGRAAEPTYLLIADATVRLLPAGELWGLSVWQTEDWLRRHHQEPDLKVASIGRAGELGVRFACLVNDGHRAAGRSGVGAVMGSKRLKAIAVRGTRGLRLPDPQGFARALAATDARLAGSRRRDALARNGTNAMMAVMQAFGGLPTRNCQAVQFAGAAAIDAAAMWRRRDGHRNLVRNAACYGCTIACQRVSRIDPGHWAARKGERYRGAGGGLEYETAFALGAMVGVADIDACTYAGLLANEHGMDPISLGGTLAAAMELYATGAITAVDTEGLALRFGDAETMCRLIEMTAAGEGFGRLIGLGAKRLCERFGQPQVAMQVKGQEIPGYDPRALQGMGLGYVTSNRGACHMRHDVFREDLSDQTGNGKAEPLMRSQDRMAVIDSTGLCCFPASVGWRFEDYLSLLNAACGQHWTVADLMRIGERIFTLERCFNQAAGFTAADDDLPARLLQVGAPSGTAAGRVCELERMRSEYYRLRGWNPDGSVPPALIERLRL